MNRLMIIIVSAILASCSQRDYKNPHVLLDTNFGNIEVELFPDKAPVTVTAFLSYIDSGFYRNSSFYRVLKAEELPASNNTGLIQGGIFRNNKAGANKLKGIVHESTRQTGLSHTDGTISLANTGPGTATTEFFICIGDQSSLDAGRGVTTDGQGFAAFGQVFKGMEVVRKIQAQESHGDMFKDIIRILRIEKL